jgi:hypothetical protein
MQQGRVATVIHGFAKQHDEHTDVPVFLAQITGASRITAPGMTLGACAAWLRWHLMGDTTQRAMFAGPDCTLCVRPNWVAKSKGL